MIKLKQGDKVVCKRTYRVHKSYWSMGMIVFKKNQSYPITLKTYQTCWVDDSYHTPVYKTMPVYEIVSGDDKKSFTTGKAKTGLPHFNNYFYSPSEYRTAKIKKLNKIKK